MAKCITCKKNATKNRVLSDGVSFECNNKEIEIDYDNAPCNPDDALGTIKFKDFVEWMLSVFVKCVKSSTEDVTEYKKKLDDTRKELAETKKELGTAKADIQLLETKVKQLTKDQEKNDKCSRDNLRYLINHDRNVRQKNILLFGLPDDHTIKLAGENFESDQNAFNHILGKLNITEEIEISDLFRLGKKDAAEEQKSRPLKICFTSSNAAKLVLSNSYRLKNAFGEGTNIYIKPDKTKAERDEFTRLGKKKTELMERHSAAESDEPRVILKNGRLLVDNVEVDSYKTPQTLF